MNLLKNATSAVRLFAQKFVRSDRALMLDENTRENSREKSSAERQRLKIQVKRELQAELARKLAREETESKAG